MAEQNGHTSVEKFTSELFTLWYRPRNNPHSMSMVFRHASDPTPEKNFRAAIQRGKNFCEAVNWVFITVKPWFVDLSQLEKKLNADSELPV